MTATAVLTRKKRISKKRKSAWRKTNVKDVEDFLEEERFDERHGTKVNTRKNEELFSIDSKPDETLLSRKEQRHLKATRAPKCFSVLQSTSKVSDPIIKRNRVRTKEERMCPLVKKKENERKLKGILKKKELQRIEDRQRHEEKVTNLKKTDILDIWESDGKKDDDGWVEKLTQRHTLRWTGKLNKVIPRMKNTLKGIIPNIEAPHPGMSYNPSYEDHQQLLREIADKELKLIKEEKHINRVTAGMFSKVTVEQNESNWMKEMSEGLPKPDEKSHEADVKIEGGKPYDTINPPVTNKKKTLQQRRKQKEQIRLQGERNKAKLEKKKVADIHKLRFIQKKIESQEKLLERQKEKRVEYKKKHENDPRQLSKMKFEEPDLEFNMGHEIAGNLKNIKTEGNLLRDRFASMQKRNVLEVTKRHNRKSAKTKKYVKSGFKDDWKKGVAKPITT